MKSANVDGSSPAGSFGLFHDLSLDVTDEGKSFLLKVKNMLDLEDSGCQEWAVRNRGVNQELERAEEHQQERHKEGQ